MQGEYTGKPIFSHRYIGMNEEDIRNEIDRLQGEVYAMEEALEYYRKDNKSIRDQLAVGQENNEKLLKQLEAKVQMLTNSLEYQPPLKAQLDATVADFKQKLNELNPAEIDNSTDKAMKRLTALTIVNTILLFVVVVLVGYSILFI